jgi:hypothetical protein
MKASLHAALRNAAESTDDSTTPEEAAVLAKLKKRQDLQKLTRTIASNTSVNRVLEEPALPSKKDLARWWPEPVHDTPNPLVPFQSKLGPPSAQLSPGSAGPLPSARSLTRTVSLPAKATSGRISPPSKGRGGGGFRPRPRGTEPSRYLGSPSEISLPPLSPSEETDVSDAEMGRGVDMPYQQAMQLEALNRSTRLSHWMAAFASDEAAFASKAVFVEMRLRQVPDFDLT